MDIFMLVMKEELTPLFILKYLKFLMGDRVFFFFVVCLTEIKRRQKKNNSFIVGAILLLCGWACLPKAVVSDFTLISAEEVMTGIANEKV